MTPRTPQERKQPPLSPLGGEFRKEGGRMRCNSWIYAFSLYKRLIVERNFLAGCPVFSTGCHVFSTGCPIFSTCPVFAVLRCTFIYLSLLKRKKERRDKGLMGNGIHALRTLPIFSSTGCNPIHGLIRGNPWMPIALNINNLIVFTQPSTHPRVVLRLDIFGGDCE